MNQSSKERAAFRHAALIRNLTCSLFADGIARIFYQTLPIFSSLSPLRPPGVSKMTGTSAHLSHLSASPSLCHTSNPAQHTRSQTHTSATLPLITYYTTDKIPRADSITLPQKRLTKRVGKNYQSTCWEFLTHANMSQ